MYLTFVFLFTLAATRKGGVRVDIGARAGMSGQQVDAQGRKTGTWYPDETTDFRAGIHFLIIVKYVSNTCWSQLRREKGELENSLEQEQEALVNKLWIRMNKLEAEKR